MLAWRNWTARLTSDQKVTGSIPVVSMSYPHSTVVSIPVFHTGESGSIPGAGALCQKIH